MSKQNAQLEQYGGGETLARIPTRNDIISECDNELTAILQQSLSNNQPIYFMPNDVSDATETRILKEIHKYGIETASDDITNMHYYRKIAREKKLPLSEWAILNDYHCISDTNLPHYSFRFSHMTELLFSPGI
ncbi:3482_t:CDS:2 [Entrophospora sp. SA101]|nr:3482_t:CDS:2 [Entrophospora sp. SA101]